MAKTDAAARDMAAPIAHSPPTAAPRSAPPRATVPRIGERPAQQPGRHEDQAEPEDEQPDHGEGDVLAGAVQDQAIERQDPGEDQQDDDGEARRASRGEYRFGPLSGTLGRPEPHDRSVAGRQLDTELAVADEARVASLAFATKQHEVRGAAADRERRGPTRVARQRR